MAISAQQKVALEEIIQIILNATPAKGRRLLSSMFLTLVDRADWPHYYEASLGQ